MNIKCTFWEWDNVRMSPFIDGVSSPIYINSVTREEATWNDIPVGALYYASDSTQEHYRPGPDGRTLFVKTPEGPWCIDSRASNCDLLNDKEHYCWVRHGIPPEIHVDKAGFTCTAGAGSILIGSYHGFLHNGYLTDC